MNEEYNVKKVLEDCLHEFNIAHGLIVHDGQPKDKPEEWQLDFSKIISEIDLLMHEIRKEGMNMSYEYKIVKHRNVDKWNEYGKHGWKLVSFNVISSPGYAEEYLAVFELRE